jgi:nucleoside-diphosphate-sugar epimerase
VGYKAFRREFDDWLHAIATGASPQLSGRSVLPVVRLVDECYRAPGRLSEPWTDGGLAAVNPPMIHTGARRRVLVTGAGGFLGCRTVEVLKATEGWDVRAIVRRPGSAARLARYDMDVVVADITDAAAMARALDGCDAVEPCAVGNGWPPAAEFKSTVEGTRVVAEAALRAGVTRFVHISSMAVHGDRVPARLDESVPLDPGTGLSYSRAKYLAECEVMAAFERGLPAIALRPARIYGPFSKTFTMRPLAALGSGTLRLAGDATTPANMVYVDNVVESILLALDAPASACGEAFLIGEPDQLSWHSFYGYFAQGARGKIETVPYPSSAASVRPGGAARWVAAGRQIVMSSEVRALAKKIMWTDPVGTRLRRLWDRSPGLQRRVLTTLGVDQAVVYREPPAGAVEPVTFRIDPTLVVFDKAQTRLGYVGRVSRTTAMELTLGWARYARLL